MQLDQAGHGTRCDKYATTPEWRPPMNDSSSPSDGEADDNQQPWRVQSASPSPLQQPRTPPGRLIGVREVREGSAKRIGSRPPVPAVEQPRSPSVLSVAKRERAEVEQLIVPSGPPRAESPLRGIVTEPESDDDALPKRKAKALHYAANAEEIPDVLPAS